MEEVSAMKIRLKFRKYGVMKFVGHLDIMRFFQKAVRMAEIDICYSQGFSPHPLMSFAAPLGVGLTSDGEYVDLDVHTLPSSGHILEAFQAVMPEGLEVTGCVQLDGKAKNAMSVVSAADYEIWYKPEYEMPPQLLDEKKLQQRLDAFFTKPQQIPVTKKTKKSEKVLDLKQLVYDFRILKPQEKYFNRPAFYLNVCTGSTDNLKPELVLGAFFESFGLSYRPLEMQIHRRDVYYTDTDGCRRPLLMAGKVITGEEKAGDDKTGDDKTGDDKTGDDKKD